jgi:hypothetical protein
MKRKFYGSDLGATIRTAVGEQGVRLPDFWMRIAKCAGGTLFVLRELVGGRRD